MQIAYWIVLILLALIWGLLERRQRSCSLANLSQSSSQGRTLLFWAKWEAITLLFVLGMFAAAFLLFSWKTGLLAMMVWFAAQHVFANAWPPNRPGSTRPLRRSEADSPKPEAEQD